MILLIHDRCSIIFSSKHDMKKLTPSTYKKLEEISLARLQGYVRDIEGLRHGWENYESLEEKAAIIEKFFCSLNLNVESQDVPFHRRRYRNIIATMDGRNQEMDWLLVGAHYDAASGSPGADDNASGVAVLLETARILKTQHLERTVQFVAFTLEEPQPFTLHFLIGSDHFAKKARKKRRKYKAVLILESVGYTDMEEGSQIIPLFIRKPVPKTGDFLGVIANRQSLSLMNAFHSIANESVPELHIVTYKVPLSGRIVPETRFSDHASFWNQGYPAIMLTDTAMFRNPYYHTHHDRFETLDFSFIVHVAKAVMSAVVKLGMDL
jgi:Iap family predicted aminopeptidase